MVGEAWGRVLKYAQENGLRPVGPAREHYLNDPEVTPTQELLTEVQLPVEG
jgi:effector-binding domain-containing protein